MGTPAHLEPKWYTISIPTLPTPKGYMLLFVTSAMLVFSTLHYITYHITLHYIPYHTMFFRRCLIERDGSLTSAAMWWEGRGA